MDWNEIADEDPPISYNKLLELIGFKKKQQQIVQQFLHSIVNQKES